MALTQESHAQESIFYSYTFTNTMYIEQNLLGKITKRYSFSLTLIYIYREKYNFFTNFSTIFFFFFDNNFRRIIKELEIDF